MKKFAIITNAYKDKKLVLTHKIVDYITQKGGSAVALSEGHEGMYEYADINFDKMPKDTECIMVLGGDGTLIRSAAKVMEYNIPLVGINIGNLGYLCELDANDVFDAIDRLMAEEYFIEERIMIEGGKNPREIVYGLNDIVIHRVGDLAVLRMNVYVNGEFLATYDADGIIVSTPTGSTGYNLSAGGPIVNPKAQMLVMTPINSHSLNARSIVFSSNDLIEIEMGTRRYLMDEEAYVSCDGDRVETLRVGERYAVSRSLNTISIARLKRKSFLEILRKKMGSNLGGLDENQETIQNIGINS
ncbi:MAG: NAD(+)/NADH kinase [Agathobacter sp.]|nr:NAD(+)/NADH kinase [Agathobacter sp.]